MSHGGHGPIDWRAVLPDIARRLAAPAPHAELVEAFVQEIATNKTAGCLLTGRYPKSRQTFWCDLKAALVGRFAGLDAARIAVEREHENQGLSEQGWAIRRAGEILDLTESYLRQYRGWPDLPRPEETVLAPARAPVTREAGTVREVSLIESALLQHLAAVREVSDQRLLAGYWGWLLSMELGLANSRWLSTLLAVDANAWEVTRHGVSVHTPRGRVSLPALSAMVGIERIRHATPPRGQPGTWLREAAHWIGVSPCTPILTLWRHAARRGHSDHVVAHWRTHGRMQPMSDAEHQLYWRGAAPEGAFTVSEDETLLPAGRPAVTRAHPSEPDMQASRATIDYLIRAFEAFETTRGRGPSAKKRKAVHEELVGALGRSSLTGSDLLVAAYLLALFTEGQRARTQKPYAASSLRRYASALCRPLRREFGIEDLRELSFDSLHERLQRVLDTTVAASDRHTLVRWLTWLARTDLLLVDPRLFRFESTERNVRTGVIGAQHWRALHAWLEPVDPNGIARALLDCYFLLGMRPDEAMDLRAGEIRATLGHGAIMLRRAPGRRLKSDQAVRTLPLGLLRQATGTADVLQRRAAHAMTASGSDEDVRVFGKHEADAAALRLTRGLRAVTGNPHLSLYSLRHSAAQLGLWQLLIQAGCMPKPIRQRYFTDPLYHAESIRAHWPEIEFIHPLELRNGLLTRLAQRMGHGGHEVTCTHYLHVPETLAWLEGMRARFTVAKAQLVPWLGGNTWAYRRIENIATTSDPIDPSSGQRTVSGLPDDGAVNAGVTIQGSALLDNYLSRERKPETPKAKGGQSQQPAVTDTSGAAPFISYLWDAQAELFAARASNDACSDDTAFGDAVFETYKAAARICDTPWHPSEIAQYRWRADLVEWATPQALGAYIPPAIEAFIASANAREAVIRHQRTLKQVLRVMALFRVPVRHIHVEARIPEQWSPSHADKRLDAFRQAASASPRTVGRWSKTKAKVSDVELHLEITDPRTPWQGLISACVWMRPWLRPSDPSAPAWGA